MDNYFVDMTIAFPEIFLSIIGMMLLIIGVFNNQKISKMINACVGISFMVMLYLIYDITPDMKVTAFNGLFVSSAYTIFIKMLILFAATMVLLLHAGSKYSDKSRLNCFEMPIILLFSVVGMLIMVSANDLIVLYLGLELQSLALYTLASIERNDSRSTEAGIKYFVLGALASGIMLYGMSLLYGFTGTTNFEILANLYSNLLSEYLVNISVLIGLVLVMIGFLFKISAAPFHMWTPDVYEGSPTIVTAFFSTAPKVAAVSVLLQFLLNPFGEWLVQWQQIIMFVSILSMFIGAFGALKQTNIKRLLAYSSIGHAGYILMAISSGTDEGVKAVLIYLVIYVFMSIGIFAFIFMMQKNGKLYEDISSLSGLSKQSPVMAAGIAILMFSMAGIPPFAGFFAKLYIFIAAINAELYILAVTGIIASVISSYYYLRIIKIIYLDEVKGKFDDIVAIEIKFVAFISVILNLLYFIFPKILIEVAFVTAGKL